MTLTKSRTGTWLLWIFVLSGFSGLIYQSIWTQYLGLFLGHSSYAQSLVLILFMGGMAIGAWLVSRWSASMRRPLLAYAIIEVVIGLLGICFDGIYQGLTGWAYDQLLPMLPSSQLQNMRWLLAAVMVLPQCILLGATFPLMSAGYIRLQAHAEGRVLAGLYFSNSLGAAIGALASTYVILPAIGMPGTVFSAGLINILVAVIVYPLSKTEVARSVDQPALATVPQGAPIKDVGEERAVSRPLLILMVAGLTGAASFVYEITWIRMLSLALGTTIHSFELMLAAFILGIAMGGLWLRNRADRMASPLVTAGWIQVWMGVAALGSMFVYANAFEWVGWLMKVIVHSSEGYGLFNLASAGIALLVMFPAAFFAGMTLPLLTLALLRQGHGEKSIGQAYAFNTVGAIVGVLAAVHVLMPVLGLKYALLTAALLDMVLGLVLLHRYAGKAFRGRVSALLPAAAISAVAAIVASHLVTFDPAVMSSSVYRFGSASLGEDANIVFFKDGKTATVTVFDRDESGAVRAIATNGKIDAGLVLSEDRPSTSDEATMMLLAAIPLSMREHHDRIGVIGFGSGMTTHTLMGHSKVGMVDTVEIEPAMVEGARHFGKRVARAYEDPRSHVIIDDAKAYFASVPNKYDLIISEPSNPWMGGTASLFSTEFYQYVPKQLNEDGLFVQWLQLYEITPELVNSVLSAMLANFKDVNAYLANEGDLILVASPHGTVPEIGSSIFQEKLLAADLSRVGVNDLRDLQDTKVMNRAGLEGYLALYPHQMNSDMYPVLKLQAPRARFERAQVADFDALATAPWPIVNLMGGASPRTGPRDPSLYRLSLSSVRQSEAAQEIYAALVEGRKEDPEHMSEFDALQVDALHGLAAACDLAGRPQRTTTLLFSLATETVAYLDPERLARMWGKPEWLRCPPGDGTVSKSLDFIAAASEQRHVDVIREGLDLLAGENGEALIKDPVSSYYIMGAMQYAALAEGDPEIAQKLVQRYWPHLDRKVQGNASLRLVALLASREGAKLED